MRKSHLRFHLERNLLPGLALYETLREDSDSQETALAETESLLKAVFAPLQLLAAALGCWADPFAQLRRGTRLLLRLGFPPQGWALEWVEDSARSVAYNVQRCFYVEVLSAYGAPELTQVFCGLDDVVFEALPPSVAWERTTTLGRGGSCCNFRWSRVPVDAQAG